MRNIASFTNLEDYIARVYAGKRCAVKPFLINFSYGAVAANSSETVQQKIPSNADFIQCWMSINSSFAASELLLQITDSGTSQTFFDSAVNASTVCDQSDTGNRDQAVYRRVAGNSTLSAAINNLTATAYGDLSLTLVGVLVYVYSGQ